VKGPVLVFAKPFQRFYYLFVEDLWGRFVFKPDVVCQCDEVFLCHMFHVPLVLVHPIEETGDNLLLGELHPNKPYTPKNPQPFWGSGAWRGYPHWSAIAIAMPVYVLLRFFQRSAPGGILLHPLGVWFSQRPDFGMGSTKVNSNFGNLDNQRQVFLLSGCPNCQGWIIWSGRCMLLMQPTGFSRHVFAPALYAVVHIPQKKSMAAWRASSLLSPTNVPGFTFWW
jgi:hypothetical protein